MHGITERLSNASTVASLGQMNIFCGNCIIFRSVSLGFEAFEALSCSLQPKAEHGAAWGRFLSWNAVFYQYLHRDGSWAL